MENNKSYANITEILFMLETGKKGDAHLKVQNKIDLNIICFVTRRKTRVE